MRMNEWRVREGEEIGKERGKEGQGSLVWVHPRPMGAAAWPRAPCCYLV